jgi:probable HAF family extracellular repeat protein
MRTAYTLLALAAMAGSGHAAEPATYRCERLVQAYSNVTDIGREGTVAGAYHPDQDDWHAAVWSARRPETLANPEGMAEPAPTPFAVQTRDDVAGSVTHLGHEHAYRWIYGWPVALPGLTDSPTEDSRVADLNGHGQAVGFSTNDKGVQHAVLWKKSYRVVDLGALAGDQGVHKTASRANAISPTGTIVGRSDAKLSTWHAVQWTGGRASLVDLGLSAYGAYSEALAVNGDDVVVGFSSMGTSTQPYRPIGWRQGALFDLKPPAGATNSRASAINDGGTVVGSIDSEDKGALVWPHYEDEPIDLNTRLDAQGCRDASGKSYRLTHGIAINARGQILAGSFVLSEGLQSFRLTPY